MSQLSNSDVVIVGAGIVGISTAISLKELNPNLKVLVLEKGRGHRGASVRNAGFACFGSISEILDDASNYGMEVALQSVKMRWKGLQLLRQRVGDINMNYMETGGFEVFNDPELQAKCLSSLPEINDLVGKIIDNDNCYSLFNGRYGITIKNAFEGILDPAMMIEALQRKAITMGVAISYGTAVESIDYHNHTIETSTGELPYNRLIIATNAWVSQILPEISVKPARNHVMITKPVANSPLNGGYHMDAGYVYFRNVDDRVLIGGGRNIDFSGESTFDTENYNTDILEYLKRILDETILPNIDYKIDMTWTGLMGVGGDKKPIIKKWKDKVWIAVKMGGMGVAIGSYVGSQVSSIVQRDIATS